MDALPTNPSRGRLRWRLPIAIGLFPPCLPLILASCGSDKVAAPRPSPASLTPSVAGTTDRTLVLNEFTIKLGSPSLSSGKVLLTANNVGNEEHELVLVRASAVTDLPTKADGSVDEDKTAETDKVGEIEHVMSHQTKSSSLQLDPGTNVVFCNVDQMGTGSMMNGNMGSGQNHGDWPRARCPRHVSVDRRQVTASDANGRRP